MNYLRRISLAAACLSVLMLAACTSPAKRAADDDARIAARLEDIIRSTPAIAAGSIQGHSVDGELTLRGRLPRRDTAQELIEAARHIPGVKKVNYDIELDEP